MDIRPNGIGRIVVAAGVAVAVAIAALAPSAMAATDAKYSPNAESRQFTASMGGWNGSADHEGLCLQALTCPAVDHEFVGSGGAKGDGGYIRADLGSLTGVGAVTKSTFRGPAFVYRGVGNKRPDRLTFSMARRADVAALLEVAGNTATYSVSLERVGSNSQVELIEPTPLTGADQWTSTGRIDVDPADVGIGKRYRLAITTEFTNGAEVIPGAEVDYDNVVLYARDRGGDGSGGRNVVSNVVINHIAGNALPGKALLTKRGVVKVELRCAAPRANDGKCRFRGLKAIVKGKAQTKKRKAAVPAKRKRFAGLKTKGTKARNRVAARKRVKLVGKVTYGGKTRKISRHVKVKAA